MFGNPWSLQQPRMKKLDLWIDQQQYVILWKCYTNFSQNQDNVLINYGLHMLRKCTCPCSWRWTDDVNAIWTIMTPFWISCGLLMHAWVHSVTWFRDHAGWVCGQQDQIGPKLSDPCRAWSPSAGWAGDSLQAFLCGSLQRPGHRGQTH